MSAVARNTHRNESLPQTGFLVPENRHELIGGRSDGSPRRAGHNTGRPAGLAVTKIALYGLFHDSSGPMQMFTLLAWRPAFAQKQP